MTEKGLSRDACLANNAGIRPLTFDLNPQDIKFTSLVVQAQIERGSIDTEGYPR